MLLTTPVNSNGVHFSSPKGLLPRWALLAARLM